MTIVRMYYVCVIAYCCFVIQQTYFLAQETWKASLTEVYPNSYTMCLIQRCEVHVFNQVQESRGEWLFILFFADPEALGLVAKFRELINYYPHWN